MKVSEAKQKACPFMSEHGLIQVGPVKVEKTTYCICGDCMAWKYTGNKIDSRFVRSHLKEEHRQENLPEDEKEGYCIRLSDRD